MRSEPATAFAYVTGTGLVAAGILGFTVTGFAGFASVMGSDLLGMSVNPLHNLLHLTTGLMLVVGAALDETVGAWAVTLLAAAAYGTLAIVGIGMTGTTGNILALDATGNVFHGLVAFAGTWAAWSSRPGARGNPDEPPQRTKNVDSGPNRRTRGAL